MLRDLAGVLLSLVVYVVLPLLCLLPISFVVRYYIRRVKLDRVLKELEYVALKLRETSPSKQKRWRIIKARYDSLYRKVRNLMWVNIFAIWAGVLIMIYVSRFASYALQVPPPYSPLRLSWTPFSVIGVAGGDDWYVVDLFLYLAVVGIFNSLHSKLSGLSVLYEV